MNSVEPLSKYALFPRLLHSSNSLPTSATSNIFLPSPKTANTGTAYLAVNSSKDSSWWGSWASTSPANLPAETEKAARWTGCCTKSALWAGRTKGVARARVALRMRAETDIVRGGVLGGGVGRSGDGRVGLFFLLELLAGLLAEVQTTTHWKLSGWRDLARRGEHVPSDWSETSGFAYNFLYFCFYDGDEYMIIRKIGEYL